MQLAAKRVAPEEGSALIKRQRTEDGALVRSGGGDDPRYSNLSAPIMLLTGHEAEVFSVKFSPDGELIASGGFDRTIFIWRTFGDCNNVNVLKTHAGAVQEVQWSRDCASVYSACTDKGLYVWDVETGVRIKKFRGHTGFLNACCPNRRGTELVASASDDRTIRIWDLRERHAVEILDHKYQVTATAFTEAGDIVFAGSLDNNIYAWDLRSKSVVYTLEGHMDTITGIRLSPDGSFLVSNSIDNTVRTWDVKPFAPADRSLLSYEGAPHDMFRNLVRPCWSSDSLAIACGSGDRTVLVWDVASKKILYKLPGHKGGVNEVDWHPKQPIIVSGSTDQRLFLGELDMSMTQ